MREVLLIPDSSHTLETALAYAPETNMTTNKILRKLARHLHLTLFQSVPNDAPAYVDLSRLQPTHRGLEMQLRMSFPTPTTTNSNRTSVLSSQTWKP
jgi:hypothetical protein